MVAVVVVHGSGPVLDHRFDEVLRGLSAQDHPNLQVLFLLTGTAEGVDATELHARIAGVLPSAHVRTLPDGLGFGAAGNEVLRLVEGESGFFCFLHDDVALDPGAIRLLVEELYRSNAGIVGPKLVDWDDPLVLQHVGLAVDRVGEVDPMVEPGEVDQEQHDAVRDVFCLPSACLLVRADLFRTIGGFEESIDFYGDDLDLCWRAHLSGARVVVVPSARARHVEQLAVRRPDLDPRVRRARHRVGTVAAMAGPRRLPLAVLRLLIVSLVELAVGIFTGSAREAWTSLVSTLALAPRAGRVAARRRRLRPLRLVPDREVVELQVRGSARLSSFLRSKEGAVSAREGGDRRRLRENVSGTVAAWIAVLAVVLIGSRGLITGGVEPIGEFLAFPSSPSDLARSYLSGWLDHGIGQPGPAPTGLALIGLGGVALLGNMGLLHTVGVVGLLFVGLAGIARLCSAFPSGRARVTGMVVYAAVPLPYAAIAGGSWSGLTCYALLPWVVHLLRRGAGIASVDYADQVAITDTDVMVAVPLALRLRVAIGLVLLTGLVSAFVPIFGLLVLAVGLVLALSTLLAGGRALVTGWFAGLAAIGAVGAFVVNLPWSTRFFADDGWTAMTGVPLAGPEGIGLADLARFGVGGSAIGVLALALYVPVVAGLVLARSWRFTWAVRGATLVVAFLAVAVAADHDALPVAMPGPAILLAPVGLGLSISAAAAAAALGDDVRGRSFGWRQPLGALTALAVSVGVLPVLVAAASGDWDQPSATLDQLLTQLPEDPAEGDYRVLYLGDPRVLPAPGWEYEPGIAYAVVDDGPLLVDEHWTVAPQTADEAVADAVEAIATEATARAGKLLGPLGIRYVVVPIIDGAASTVDDPLPPPSGLIDALGDQLDLRQRYDAAELQIFENTAWIPVRAALSGATADASNEAGAEALVRADLSQSSPVLVGAETDAPFDGPVPGGTVTVAVPLDDGWSLRVDGTPAASRPAFGLTTAFEVPGAGEATLEYDTPWSRTFVVIVQLVVWALLLMAALRREWVVPRRRRPAAPAGPAETIVDFAQMSADVPEGDRA